MRLNSVFALAFIVGSLTAAPQAQEIRWVHHDSYGVAAASSNRLVTAGGQGLIKLWSHSNSVPVFARTFSSGRETPISQLSVTDDGNTVVSVDAEGAVRVWNVADGSNYTAAGPSRFLYAQHHRKRNLLGVLNGGSELRIH